MKREITKSTLIPLAFAADYLLATGGKKPCNRTLRRWAVEGRDGRVLRVVRIGPTWWTRHEWIDQFIADLSRSPKQVVIQTKKARVQRALDELRKKGIKLD